MRPAVLRRAAVVAAPVLLAACALLTWWHGHGSIWWAPQRCFSCNVTRVAFITAGAMQTVVATFRHAGRRGHLSIGAKGRGLVFRSVGVA